MVSEGKEQAIQHLSKAKLAFIAVLRDAQGPSSADPDGTNNAYGLIFENVTMARGVLDRIEDGTQFEYRQSPKGLKFKVEGENDKERKQAAVDDDQVKEPKPGKTYLAILTDPGHIDRLVEIDPHDINEILQSAADRTPSRK